MCLSKRYSPSNISNQVPFVVQVDVHSPSYLDVKGVLYLDVEILTQTVRKCLLIRLAKMRLNKQRNYFGSLKSSLLISDSAFFSVIIFIIL